VKAVGVVAVAGLALTLGSLGTWIATRTSSVPDAVFCEVTSSTAAVRGLSEGSFVDGTDSGCAPGEPRFCIEAGGSVLHLKRC
jgi:hypothetical protein